MLMHNLKNRDYLLGFGKNLNAGSMMVKAMNGPGRPQMHFVHVAFSLPSPSLTYNEAFHDDFLNGVLVRRKYAEHPLSVSLFGLRFIRHAKW